MPCHFLFFLIRKRRKRRRGIWDFCRWAGAHACGLTWLKEGGGGGGDRLAWQKNKIKEVQLY